MHFLYYVSVFAVISIATAQYLEYQPVNLQAPPPNHRTLQVPEFIDRNRNPTLAYTLQLPRADVPNVPFYNSEELLNLQPPRNEHQSRPPYYEYPTPAVDLQAPTEGSWNPNNDPNLYYSNEPVLIDLETPTDMHPKKYSKDSHEKKYSGEPKKEILLTPATSDDFARIQKTVNKLAKLENQKQIRNEKVPTKSRKSISTAASEPQSAYSNINDNVVDHLSASMIRALGAKTLPGERFQFHMHGHTGPNSYMWGFDTGKGRNRQFRFEERDENGYVKGQYGYYDKSGKLHMFHYDAHPQGGFNAKSSTDKH